MVKLSGNAFNLLFESFSSQKISVGLKEQPQVLVDQNVNYFECSMAGEVKVYSYRSFFFLGELFIFIFVYCHFL